MTGRTSWWAKDAAWHRRELIVELGDEHASAGPNVMDVLSSMAQEQRAGGAVRGGFRTLARESFCSPEKARAVVEMAAAIGALDDLEIDPDGRRFTCRLSGWTADQERGRATFRKAAERDKAGSDVTGCHGESRQVTPSALPDQTRPDQEGQAATPQRSRASQPDSSSRAGTVACPRCDAPAGEKCNGARKKRDSFHLERHHAVGELTHLKPTAKRAASRDRTISSSEKIAAEYERAAREKEFCSHFPGVPQFAVMRAVRDLNREGLTATVEAVRARLEVAA